MSRHLKRSKAAPLAAVVVVVIAVAFLPSSAFAQDITQINGRVTDQEGLPLPGATLTVTDEASGYLRTAVSGAGGSYLITRLPPGTYTLSVSLQGFQGVTSTALELLAGAEVTINWTLQLGEVEEVITVTGRTPLIEVTSNKLGGTLSSSEIEQIPVNFRRLEAYAALFPGMTPDPSQSTFEGGQMTAGGNTAWSNVYLIDGIYNNDDRLGASQGTQVRMVVDSVAELQVLAHQYDAEFGGGNGALLNFVSKRGSNNFRGTAYSYFRDDRFDAEDPFLPAGISEDEKPQTSTLQAGFTVSGPIVRNVAHFFFNYERDNEVFGGFKRFPAEGAPIAVDQVGEFEVRANNSFARVDVQANENNFLSWRLLWEAAPALGEGFNTSDQVADARAFEGDWDLLTSGSWTSIIGDRGTNEVRFGHIREDLRSGSQAFFEDGANWVGIAGRSPFAIGQQNSHPSYTAGLGGGGGRTIVRTWMVDDAFTYFVPDWGGDHTFKAGGGFSLNRIDPRTAVDSGTFFFDTDLPFDPSNPATFPTQFEINLLPDGSEGFPIISRDWRVYAFFQDKWRVTDRLTLNLGVRYDVQELVPGDKDDLAPRAGFAFDPLGDGKTVIRGGIGRYNEYTRQFLAVRLQQFALANEFPAVTINDPTNPVLQPDLTTDSDGNAGIAMLSQAGQATLLAIRDAILAGTSFNANPFLDSPNRAMPYAWSWSLGIQRQLAPDVSLALDYVANVSRDQLGALDINEPVNGVRPGVDVFDPNGTLIPAAARGVNFGRVLQYVTGSMFDGDYKALEVALVKRYSDNWSFRGSYTLQKSNYVGQGFPSLPRRVWLDNDPRADFGRASFNRTHVLSLSGSVNPIGGLTIGGVVTAMSNKPVNETTGTDTNSDRDRNDRPITGIDDVATGIPILSATDSAGRAVINGIDGQSFTTLDLSARYYFDIATGYGLTLFLDAYNLTDTTNFNNPTGNRSSSLFLGRTPTSIAGFPRQMQFGIRVEF